MLESTLFDSFMLSRIQFAANVSFHILFPTITIALCWILCYFKIRSDISGHPVWMRAYRFWIKVFALTFALGVVSGITMSFQFGTNWPGFMEKVGNIAGPLLGYEVLTAFFLEATFLGIMLFGSHRVPNWLHTLSTLLVAFGTTMSAFWIISLNSWMHTPTGFELRDGIAYPLSWIDIIFNPSMPYRLAHVLLSSGLTAAFLLAGLSAFRIFKGDKKQAPRVALKTGVFMAAILIPIQIFVGDMHGLNTLEHQPQKIAAIEGVWNTEKGAPLVLFGIPDAEEKTTHFEVSLPGVASFILTHDFDGELKGLNEFEGETPPVGPLFWGFRIMVGIGALMLLVSWWCGFQLWRKGEVSPLGLKVLIGMTFSGWLATLAGWYVTEIGRQPYLVYGVLTTQEAVTQVPPSNIAISLAMYLTLYAVLIVAYLHTLVVLSRKAIETEEYEITEAVPEPAPKPTTNPHKNPNPAATA